MSLHARVRLAMVINTPSERSCIVRRIACEIDQLKFTKYSNSSTACCDLSAVLPLDESTRSDFSCVTIESCTFVRHLDRSAARLHITDCSLNAFSHLLKVSWLNVWEAGAEGTLLLATLENVLFSFAGSGDQTQYWEPHPFLQCACCTNSKNVESSQTGHMYTTIFIISRRITFSNSYIQLF